MVDKSDDISDDIWNEIVKLAEDIPTFGWRQLGKKRVMTPETDLVADLGLIGDDALEFMDKYATVFKVAPGDYDFASYFDSEQLWLLPRLSKAKKKNPLTLGMLALAAKMGVWDAVLLEDARVRDNIKSSE